MKTKYRNEITAFEFLKANPDLTSAELAKAMGRGVCSISSHMHQLHAIGRVIQTGIRDGVPTWRVNDMPFGCSNPIRMMFDNLLKECRATA
ncbi:hypothetical protein WI942_002489 [Klebsiella aerogenes]|uniref:hypothetical protein n=1 Tax=Klebsiella aerogenes TaxID=548 RepID=UPI0007A99C1D|nr:hypothetical protein [Klebsiella aerogenes]EKZ5443028.1 hypothetical protein [Klebsiella aerogenes]EKZ6358423.1 hypothetical protein [Klebsiella aerogenes]SAJ18400.1 Uncharacterised protein [Klebsiella aerogenes]HDG8261141.1 hypothetical protein [Klebsiella aerogenes]